LFPNRQQPQVSLSLTMSFQDIEAGFGSSSPSNPNNSSFSTSESHPDAADAAFKSLQSSLSLQMLKINANVQGILKLVDQLGTGRDSASLRKSLHDLTDSTRAMAKRGTEDLKKLTAQQAKLPHQKTSLQKTSHDFQLSLVSFQRAQQLSAERQRTVVQGVKMAVEELDGESGDGPSAAESPSSPSNHQAQTQAQLLQSQLSPHELAYQESLIQEREEDIREIEAGVHELAEIFRDLGTMVHQQGGMLDNIDYNIQSVHVDTSRAAEELNTAHEYQRKAGRRAACLMIILVIVVAIVLLAILS
jgi:t-SNARE complex subunit (syntaxin)